MNFVIVTIVLMKYYWRNTANAVGVAIAACFLQVEDQMLTLIDARMIDHVRLVQAPKAIREITIQLQRKGYIMKRLLLMLFACMIVAPVAVFAQGEPGWNKMSLGANFEVAVPVGDFANIAGTGYGGNFRYQWGGDARAVFTATAGYLVWGKKEITSSTSIQPKAFNFFLGGKYYFVPGFYGSLEGGMYFISYTYEGSFVGAEGSVSRFMLPIGIGYQKSGFELGVRYMLLDADFNSFSFTLGYNFML